MYRIVKRIVHTITTVTLLVRWEDPARRETVEEQITLPASYARTEEEVTDTKNIPNEVPKSSNPTSDREASPKRDKGENS